MFEGLGVHLLLLVGDHLAFGGLAQAIALDRMRQDNRRLALVRRGGRVGGMHLLRIVATADQVADVVIRHVGNHRLELGVLAKEVLARERAALGLEVLVLAVDAGFHDAAQDAVVVLGQQPVPAGAPQDLDDVPAGAQERGFELLDDLAVAAHRAVETLQVAVDDEHEVIEAFAHRHGERAHRLGLVHFAVAAERPDLAVGDRHQAAVFHVAHEARLVDGHHRPQAHGHRRELPEVRHEPGVRIGRQATAADFLAEAFELGLSQAPFQVGAGIDARRTVALHEDHVAGVRVRLTAPEVVEAHFVQRGRRRVAGQMTAVFGGHFIGLGHHGHGVPAHIGLEPLLDGAVARVTGLLRGRNGVHVSRIGLIGQVGPGTTCVIDEAFQQEMGAVCAAGT